LSMGGVDRTRDSVTYAAKGTVQLNSSHRIDVSFFGDPSTGLNGPQRGTSLLNQTTAAFSSLSYGGHNQTVRYDGAPSGKWLIEAYFAHAENSIAETPSVDTWNVVDRTVTPNITTGGIGFYEPGNRSTSQQWAIKSTNVLGPHQIKYGFEFDRADWNQLNNYTGP